MRKIYNLRPLIFLLFFNYCFSQSDVALKSIVEFESYFGTKESNELNILVRELEHSLKKRYGNNHIEICYKMFVEEYAKTQKISLELTDDFIKISKNKRFVKNFYKLRKPYKMSRKFAKLTIEMPPEPNSKKQKIRDIARNFYISLQKTEQLDEVSKKYLSIFINSGGVVDYSTISYFFEVKADYTNYFHKRFLLVFFYI